MRCARDGKKERRGTSGESAAHHHKMALRVWAREEVAAHPVLLAQAQAKPGRISLNRELWRLSLLLPHLLETVCVVSRRVVRMVGVNGAAQQRWPIMFKLHMPCHITC